MRKRSALAATLLVAVLCTGDIHGSGFAVTSARALAVTADGKVWVIGEGTVNGLDEVTAVAAGATWAWGRNSEGQLADGTREDRGTPVRVGQVPTVVDLSAASGHAVAAT